MRPSELSFTTYQVMFTDVPSYSFQFDNWYFLFASVNLSTKANYVVFHQASNTQISAEIPIPFQAPSGLLSNATLYIGGAGEWYHRAIGVYKNIKLANARYVAWSTFALDIRGKYISKSLRIYRIFSYSIIQV